MPNPATKTCACRRAGDAPAEPGHRAGTHSAWCLGTNRRACTGLGVSSHAKHFGVLSGAFGPRPKAPQAASKRLKARHSAESCRKLPKAAESCLKLPKAA
eukprot:2056501-Alexandrium_andersonii.AAC.1